MVLPALVSALHVWAFGLGLGGVFVRARSLRQPLDSDEAWRRLFWADNFWGIAAGLWLVTGLARALGGLEKGADFYTNSSLFWVKMGLFGVVVALEVAPMVALIRWRLARRHGRPVDTSRARLFAIFSDVQTLCVLAIPPIAALMARGVGMLS